MGSPVRAAAAATAALALCAALTPARACAAQLPATAEALAQAMRGRPLVLLGEVHDNAAQHALRLAALKLLIAGGARPALAFEQFDREHQQAIDAARRERPRDADFVITRGKGAPSWRWELYRPFVEFALDHDLPIVAANLSRGEAMKLALTGAPSGLPELPAAFVRVHEKAIAKGHCDLLPADALPGMANAQIARDRVLAESIRPYAARGVVLLTGNGHARVDVGVPFWLTPEERARAVSIGLVERDEDGGVGESASHFDAFVVTIRADRPDPCEELRQRYRK
ncbi:MAG: ChaN family lipoprotein [Burkholderiales bacterium]|jgi:uncharacterized iron-regulated protein|nr:ChaN family lipoprotein [Burkholderiales bacterium]